MADLNRREVASRDLGIIKKAAVKLTAWGITPDQISVASMVFAFIGAFGIYKLLLASDAFTMMVDTILALVGIQGRLICNVLDGLVAIEGGKKSPVGSLYNEVPDRVSDTLLLLAPGFALSQRGFPYGALLSLLASFAALATAYIRVLGGSLGLPQSFRGPMAKQHRMALLNIGVVFTGVELLFIQEIGKVMIFVLVIIFTGSLLTSFLRLRDIGKFLRADSKNSPGEVKES